MTQIFGDTGFCQPLNTTIADLSTTGNFTPLFLMDLGDGLEVGDVVDSWLEFQVTTNNDDRSYAPSDPTFEYKRIGSICAFMAISSEASLSQNTYIQNMISGNTGTNIPFLTHHQPVRQHGRFVVSDPLKRYLVAAAYAEANKANWQPLVVNYTAGECRMCYTITKGGTNAGSALGNGANLVNTPSGVAKEWTLTTGFDGYSGWTVACVIPESSLNTPSGVSSYTRLTLSAGNKPTGIGAAYIGHRATSGDSYDFSSTPIQLKSGGNGSFVVPQNGSLVLDESSFAWDKTRDIVVRFYINGGSNSDTVYRLNTGASAYVFEKNANEAATVNASGFSASSYNPNTIAIISKIEMDGY